MYEEYSKQALPCKEYRELLGTALVVFNSNNSFIIENILNSDEDKVYSWHELIDFTSGQLKLPIKETITKKSNTDIANTFSDLIQKRNRIIHSYQRTNSSKKQALVTKDKNHIQYEISMEFLLNFIKENDRLSDLLHIYRGY